MLGDPTLTAGIPGEGPLTVAEIELEDEAQTVVLPGWIGEEVTGDSRYLNANLFKHPFCRW